MGPVEPTTASRSGFFVGPDGLVRPIWRAVLFVPVFVVLAIVPGIGLSFLLESIRPGTLAEIRASQGTAPVPMLPFYVLMDVVLLLVSWLLLAALDRRSFRALGFWFYRGWGRELLLGVGLGAALVGAVVVVLASGGWLAYQGWNENLAGAAIHTLELGIFLVFAAAAEELIFRGYPFQRLVDSLGVPIAVAIPSLLFGFAHLGNPSATPLSTANTVLAGVLLAAAYLKTRALWLPIGLHWAWNFLMGPVLGLPVSGYRLGGLLGARVSGPEWLTGGTYGPEGSVVLTVVCAVAAVWLWRSRWVAPSTAMQQALQ